MSLLCGTANYDITPYDFVPGIPLAGFDPNRKATDILDPLQASVLYLSDSDNEVIFVTVDLIGLTHPFVEYIRDCLVGTVRDTRKVIICSTHNHAGPDTIGLWGPSFFGLLPRRSGVNPAYMDQLARTVVGAVKEAISKTKQVSIRAARFDVPSDWFRNDRKGGGKDDFGMAIAFDGTDGRRVATLVNFGAHPEALWEANTCVSADYPGALRRRIAEMVGGVALFFSGALGGMVTPAIDRKADLDFRKKEKERLGLGLADLAEKALEKAPHLDETSLTSIRLPLRLCMGNRLFRVLRSMGIIDREFIQGMVKTEINLVRIGDITILTAPGECTPEVGRELLARCPGEFRLLFCLGCDELGYILTPDQYKNPEYRFERSMSLCERTATELYDAVETIVRFII